MTRHITTEEVAATMLALAEENPNARNTGYSNGEGCLYTDVNGCHCFAGETLDRLSVRIPGLMDRHNDEVVDVLISGRESILGPFWDADEYTFDPGAVTLLSVGQGDADEGFPWGVVVENLRENWADHLPTEA